MNILHQVPYLRTSREFPEEIHQLTVEVNRSYVDVANAVNARIIGVFPVNRPVQTGESWFFSTTRHQALRQVYEFGAIAAGGILNIPYKVQGFFSLVSLSGSVITNQPDQRPIPYSSVSANSNIETLLDTNTNQIRILVGSGSPNVVSGFIVFTWLSQV